MFPIFHFFPYKPLSINIVAIAVYFYNALKLWKFRQHFENKLTLYCINLFAILAEIPCCQLFVILYNKGLIFNDINFTILKNYCQSNDNKYRYIMSMFSYAPHYTVSSSNVEKIDGEWLTEPPPRPLSALSRASPSFWNSSPNLARNPC